MAGGSRHTRHLVEELVAGKHQDPHAAVLHLRRGLELRVGGRGRQVAAGTAETLSWAAKTSPEGGARYEIARQSEILHVCVRVDAMRRKIDDDDGLPRKIAPVEEPARRTEIYCE